MTLSIRSAILMGALACVTAANPLPQNVRVDPLPDITAYCTSTSFVNLLPQATPTAPTVVTVTRHTVAVLEQTAVDCGGCAHLEVRKRVPDFDHAHANHPLPTSFETVVAAEPTTLTRKYCSGFSKLPPREPDRRRVVGGMDELMDFVQFDDDTGMLFQGDEGENCTARVLQVPKINLGPTRTVFTTTKTTSRVVNCGTCTNASPVPIPLGVPPVAIFTTTITAKEPFTETELVCGNTTSTPSEVVKHSIVTVTVSPASAPNVAAATTPSEASVPSIVTSTDFPKGVPTPDCFLTYALQPDRLDSISSVFTSTVTHTSRRVCGPCALIWWTAPYDHTITSFSKTVTKKEPMTETALACED
ncbi:hypothetical protein TARUN_5394 [Trichoderma arundinaceum]|uniref:Uncharacterized protein n=1 Tax=Trichoderma arundinaceum TaxID=490622 RepID=A0A395NL71_TRIAR|nr:hypothetical protein TARUN_5394 [Trichoderma arundinaceum]